MTTTPSEAKMTFSARITKGSSEALLTAVERHAHHGVERVRLAVDTEGGEVASAMILYSTLSSMGPELVTHNTHEVASMGIVLFLAGDRRIASPEAEFFLHPITIEVPAGWKTAARSLDLNEMRDLRTKVERSGGHPKMLAELDWGGIRLEREERAVRTVLEQRTKLTRSEIEAVVQRSEPVDAEYAKAVGIVHDVSAPGL